jgi:hypothetical protein
MCLSREFECGMGTVVPVLPIPDWCVLSTVSVSPLAAAASKFGQSNVLWEKDILWCALCWCHLKRCGRLGIPGHSKVEHRPRYLPAQGVDRDSDSTAGAAQPAAPANVGGMLCASTSTITYQVMGKTRAWH